LDIKGIEDMSELKGVFFAFLVERTLEVEDRIGATRTGAGVAKNI
jgi:hypothetical protein